MEQQHLDGIQRAKRLALQGLDETIFLSQGRDNINNNNYNNYHNDYYNDITTFNDDADGDNQKLVDSVISCQASPRDNSLSQEAKRGNVIAETEPPWKYIKLDLFDNASSEETNKGIRKLKLKVNFLTDANNEYQKVIASMGGRWRDVKRGMDLTGNQEDISHYDMIEQVYNIYKEVLTNVSASKCYQSTTKGKGHSIFGLSAVVGEKEIEGEYSVTLIYGSNIQEFDLTTKGLTKKQRDSNQIASGSWGTTVKNRVTLTDLLKGK